MPKSKRVTIRLDDILDSALKRACEDSNCSKTAFVIKSLKNGLGVTQNFESKAFPPVRTKAIPSAAETKAASSREPEQAPKGWVSEMHYESGCIDRYDKEGRLRMHLRPDPKVEGAYWDTFNNRWYKNKSGEWVGMVARSR